MKKYFDFIISSSGRKVTTGSVSVLIYGTATPASLFSDAAGTVPIANPVPIDSRGYFEFYAADGRYSLTVNTPDFNPVTLTDIVLDDPASGADIGYTPAGAGAVATTVQAKLRESVSVKDFGAVGDGVADDTVALQLARTAALNGTPIHFPKGIYLTSQGLVFTSPVTLTADFETRIKLTAYALAVVELDYTGGGGSFDHGGVMENLVLDGGTTNAMDGLLLKAVISASFRNIRATNITRAGLHCAWAQLCNFENFSCSGNIEAFGVTPTNGILADTASSSANTFFNPCIEKVSGCGIKAENFINTIFINGTSEGNGTTGIEFGVAAGTATSIGNNVICMDLEVNPTADIICHNGAAANTFIGLAAGYLSGPVQTKTGSANNSFFGGVTGGFTIDSGSINTVISNTSLIGASSTIANNGTRTRSMNVRNISTAAILPDIFQSGSRVEAVVASGDSYTIDCRASEFFVLQGNGSFTVNNPNNPVDGQSLDINIWNLTGGAITVTWDTAIRMAGWINPASGMNRSVKLRYNANFARWYVIAVSTADAAN